MVSWQDICQPKSQGGLGVTDIKMMNVVLMAKWIWRMFLEQNSDLLWLRLLRAKYRVSELFSSPNPVGCSPFWHSIHRIKEQFRLGVRFHPGAQSKISFWNDLWIGADPLRVRFPSLFLKSSDSNISIAQAYSMEGWRIPFRRNLDHNDVQAWQELCEIVEDIDLVDSPDMISWHLEPSRTFSSRSLYLSLCKKPEVPLTKYLWSYVYLATCKGASPLERSDSG
jgi:hypothetical protein